MLKPLSLKNGLTVIRLPRPANLFVVGFVIPTGYSIERFHYKPGLAYLVERLFCTGTDKHITKRALNRALEGIGGRMYTQTSAEFTGFYITVPSDNQFKAVTMLSEIIQHSAFDPKDIDTEKKAIIDQIRTIEMGTVLDTVELSQENIYADYGYSQTKYGTAESVASITEEDILDFLQRQYTPGVTYLVTSGNFASKEIADQISTEWGYWNPKAKPTHKLRHLNMDELKDSLPRVLFKQRGGVETVVNCGFLLDEGVEPRVLRETSEEAKQLLDVQGLQERLFATWAELIVLNSILGQGISSRLWLKGVEEDAIFDTVSTEVVMHSRSGFFHISAVTDSAQFGTALETMLSAVDALRKINIPQGELDKAKEMAKGKLVIDHEDLLYNTQWLSENMIMSGLTFTLEDLLKEVNRVDSNSLRKFAQKLFHACNFFLTTLGTSKESSVIEKLVEKYLN
jgi:predicted Zn-dependent peptidase